ncbi:MAG: hemerythrin domain-containing protein [bacterium]
MDPIHRLVSEHEIIQSALLVLQKITNDTAQAGRVVHSGDITKLIDFFIQFADKWHHGKEEDLLFPALEEIGISKKGGPIGVMLNEHVQGREFVRGIKESLVTFDQDETKGTSDFLHYARGYVRLLTQHIEKENNVLFVMAGNHLPEETIKALENQFDHQLRNNASVNIQDLIDMVKELKTTYQV